MKKKIFLVSVLLSSSLLCSNSLWAQDIYRRNYSGDVENSIQDQAAVIFEEADNVLTAYPPIPNPGMERKLALYSLDGLLHDPRLDKGPAFMSYVQTVSTRLSFRRSNGLKPVVVLAWGESYTFND